MLMKSKISIPIILTTLILFVSCNGNKNKEKYTHMPEELANLCIQIDENPGDAGAYSKRAQYYLKTNLIDSAYYDAYMALKYDSSNPERYIFLADLFFMQAQFESSEEILEKAYAKAPKNTDVIMKLAEIQLYYKRYTEMNDFLNKALELDGRNPQAFFMKGYAYKEQGDTMNAIRNYNKAVDQNPGYYDAYIQLGLLYHVRHNPIALDYYNNALNVQPQSVEAHYNIAMFYQETGNFQKAKERYQMILQIDKNNKWSYHNLGWIAMEFENKLDDAIDNFSKALVIDQNFVEAAYNRGVAYEKKGDKKMAVDNYNQALKINPEYEMALQRIHVLEVKKGK